MFILYIFTEYICVSVYIYAHTDMQKKDWKEIYQRVIVVILWVNFSLCFKFSGMSTCFSYNKNNTIFKTLLTPP